MHGYGLVLFDGETIGSWRMSELNQLGASKMELNLEPGYLEKIDTLASDGGGATLQFLVDPDYDAPLDTLKRILSAPQ